MEGQCVVEWVPHSFIVFEGFLGGVRDGEGSFLECYDVFDGSFGGSGDSSGGLRS